MKLRNKRTGEIKDATMSYREGTAPIVVSETTCDENGQSQGWPYDSLAELIEEWEDAPEEPKKYWTVDCGLAVDYTWHGEIHDLAAEAVGFKFDTKEECERAIEKLQAFKRLKDKGFRFKGYTDDSGDLFSCQVIRCSFDDFGKESRKDLDLLFSGGEE